MNTERIQHIYSNATTFLGQGIDSVVCAIPPESEETKRYVAKFYKHWLPLPQLDFYSIMTNEASRIAAEEQWSWDFGRRYGKLAIRVVPFEGILFHSDLPVGIAEQIPGRHCDEFDSYVIQPFEDLSGFMNKRLDVSGICIIPLNAKITAKNGTLFITDLCDEIMNLRPTSISGTLPASRQDNTINYPAMIPGINTT